MAARKNTIKDLRQEVIDLRAQLAASRHTVAVRERQLNKLGQRHSDYLFSINQHTNGLANVLKYKFMSELTWMELSNDSTSKFRYIKQLISELNEIAKYHNDETSKTD